jgi:hypothetical protein
MIAPARHELHHYLPPSTDAPAYMMSVHAADCMQSCHPIIQTVTLIQRYILEMLRHKPNRWTRPVYCGAGGVYVLHAYMSHDCYLIVLYVQTA